MSHIQELKIAKMEIDVNHNYGSFELSLNKIFLKLHLVV